MSKSSAAAEDASPSTAPATSAVATAAIEPQAQSAVARPAIVTSEAEPKDTAEARDSDPPEAERARRLFERGAEAFAARRNAEAIGYFRRAAELVPSPKLTYNIAVAYEEMGDHGRALAEYRSYLRRDPDPTLREEVARRIQRLEQNLAALGVQQLAVVSEPPGATLHIDGRLRGLTPWAGELEPGVYEVALALPNHRERRIELMLPLERATEIAVTLEPETTPHDSATEAARGLSRVHPLTWGLLGVGAGALAGGVAFELSRASSSERAGRAGTEVAAAQARGAANAKQMASLVLLGSGAAFLITGGVLMLLDLSAPGGRARDAGQRARDTHVGLPCGSGFCGLALEQRF